MRALSNRFAVRRDGVKRPQWEAFFRIIVAQGVVADTCGCRACFVLPASEPGSASAQPNVCWTSTLSRFGPPTAVAAVARIVLKPALSGTIRVLVSQSSQAGVRAKAR